MPSDASAIVTCTPRISSGSGTGSGSAGAVVVAAGAVCCVLGRLGLGGRLVPAAVQEARAEGDNCRGDREDGKHGDAPPRAPPTRPPPPLAEFFVWIDGLEQHRGSGTVFPSSVPQAKPRGCATLFVAVGSRRARPGRGQSGGARP